MSLHLVFIGLLYCRHFSLNNNALNTALTLRMKANRTQVVLLGVALTLATIGSANAAGCLKGAVVGGVAGHYAGHHAVVGAVGGCIVGRHIAKQHAQQAAQQHAEMHASEQPH
jgi:outer membrane lipoprotein SlyB